MSVIKVPLKHGYKVGESVFKNAFIRPYTAADLMDAEEESERLVATQNKDGEVEHKLVLSPALYGRNIFRRQIISIDDVSGPFTIEELTENLHLEDFVLLQQKTEELDNAMVAKQLKAAVEEKTEAGKP